MADELYVREGGGAGPTLVLLHGLGATGAVWDGLIAVLEDGWPGRWIAPDLAGHGRSPHRAPYSFGRYAAEVAALLGGPDDRDGDVHVLGHSMGGVVALALASGWFGVAPRSAVGLGIKVSWSEEEAGRARALARREVQWFATREEAAERYLRVSGLAALADAAGPLAADGLAQGEGGWRLSQDPATFGVGLPDMHGLLAAARCDTVLAAGEHDPLSCMEDLRALPTEAVCLQGLGHNAHVEDPRAVRDLLAHVTSVP